MAVWVLTGFMGCGKSSIGRAAQRLAAPADPVSFPAGRKKGENLPEDSNFNDAGRKTGGNLPEHLTFIDLDEEIVRRAGRTIPEIFATDGEDAFRAIEKATLTSLFDSFHGFRAQKPPFHARSADVQGCRAQNGPFYAPNLSEAGVPPSGVRFAHPTIGQGRRSPRFRAAGGTSLSGVPLPPTELLLALGGGTLMSEECRELVKKNAKCIYLRAKVETLAENLRADDVAGRPMLAGVNLTAPADAPDSLESRIAAMMALRGPIYEKTADIILDIDGLTYEDAARQILNSF